MPPFARPLLILTVLVFLCVTQGPAAGGIRSTHLFLLAWLCFVSIVFGIWLGRRFGATLGQSMPTVIALSVMTGSLWVLPVLVFPDSLTILTLAVWIAPLQMLFSLLILSRLGRYMFTDRSFPPLEGRARDVVEAALERTGVRPISIHSAPLSNFNAAVQGIGKCAVVVDKRAADSLNDSQLSALIGHECGHVRTGGLTPYLATMPITGVTIQAVVGWSNTTPSIIQGLTLWLLLHLALSQALEFYCDRYSGKLFSPEAMSSLLQRLYDDYPRAIRRFLEHPIFYAVSTHPPGVVRINELTPEAPSTNGPPPRNGSFAYITGWSIAFFLVLFPLALQLATPSADEPAWQSRLGIITSSAYVIWVFSFWIVVGRAQRRSHIGHFGLRSSSGTHRVLTILGGVATLSSMVVLTRVAAEHRSIASVSFLICAILFLSLLLFGILTGKFRRGTILALPAAARPKVISASAALLEGHPREALEILSKIHPKHSSAPWVISLRGAAQLLVGELDEAAESLDTLLAERPDFTPALVTRANVAIGRTEPDRLREFVDQLGAAKPTFDAVHHTRGLACLELMEPARAIASFRAVQELKPADASAIAGEVIAALMQGTSPTDLEERLTEAETLEPRNSLVHLARAAWAHHSSDPEGAQQSLAEAIAELNKRQWLGWVPTYERWAERWGLEPSPAEEAPSTEPRSDDG